MDVKMNPTVQRICLFCGPMLMVPFFAALLLMHWFPPAHPLMTAGEVQRFYLNHTTGIRVGCLLILAAGSLYVPFLATITAQMKRIEGRYSPLAYVWLGCGLFGALFFIVPTLFWEVAAFRPGRDATVTQTLNDAGWITLVAEVFPPVAQGFALGFAILTDKREQPVYQRWVGFFNIWVALLFVPSCLVLFFKTGPFAWNGIFTFWLAATAFTIWLIVMVIVSLDAIRRQQAEERLNGHSRDAETLGRAPASVAAY